MKRQFPWELKYTPVEEKVFQKVREECRTMKLKLLPKFVLSLGVLGVALTVTISLFSYLSSKEYLEEMYAQRVISGSKSVAAMLDITDVRRILGPGR